MFFVCNELNFKGFLAAPYMGLIPSLDVEKERL
jgi:hypothetical protein